MILILFGNGDRLGYTIGQFGGFVNQPGPLMAGKTGQNGRTEPVCFTVSGEPCSKANSRRLVLHGSRPASIKSAKALSYLEDFHKQCPVLDPLFEGDLHVSILIHYASRRPDLDESLILDAMQGRIYRNDRQVKSKHITWGLDREAPRASIRIEPLDPSQRSYI